MLIFISIMCKYEKIFLSKKWRGITDCLPIRPSYKFPCGNSVIQISALIKMLILHVNMEVISILKQY